MKFITLVLYTVAKRLFYARQNNLEASLQSAHSLFCAKVRPHLPPHLIAALLLAEDHRFSRHHGIDPVALCRALWYFGAHRKLIGGSTLEQQLARTLTGDKQRTIGRKVREFFMAAVVESTVPKEDIPGLYLSVAYFGWRMNGIEEACQRLGVNLRLLTRRESAELVARLKYPEPSNPSNQRTDQIGRRARYIFSMMDANTTPAQAGERAVGNRETIPDLL